MPSRRLILNAVMAGAATAASAGILWWRHGRHEPSADDTGLWQLTLPRPGGGELAMAALKGRPLLINFWATWCAPCVKELPEIDRFGAQFSGRGAVVALALDNPEAVATFVKQHQVKSDVGIVGFEGTSLARALGNERGVLPFTVLLNAAGEVVAQKIGQTDMVELQSWANRL